jgi:hypothetical protein
VALTWDDSKMVVTQSDLAKAEAGTGGVRIDFGAVIEQEPGGGNDVRLQKRILLDPESAKNLMTLLNNMISRQNSQQS